MERIGQKVKIVLEGERYFTGIILEEDNHMIVIKDKYGERVTINKNSIMLMQEVGQ